MTACEIAARNRLMMNTVSNGSRCSPSRVDPRMSTNMLTTYRSSPPARGSSPRRARCRRRAEDGHERDVAQGAQLAGEAQRRVRADARHAPARASRLPTAPATGCDRRRSGSGTSNSVRARRTRSHAECRSASSPRARYAARDADGPAVGVVEPDHAAAALEHDAQPAREKHEDDGRRPCPEKSHTGPAEGRRPWQACRSAPD